ncbi:unnamed protein product [Caenorhabditis auriculariae]|uniref:Uncharacterized protein n=1 Tax=Caenorhabditis auriculariae TaxID=2777116 RepID=A0A8S1HTR2_9PELO|nr:unnamed protein product [Caenorhabditis auriculariae]
MASELIYSHFRKSDGSFINYSLEEIEQADKNGSIESSDLIYIEFPGHNVVSYSIDDLVKLNGKERPFRFAENDPRFEMKNDRVVHDFASSSSTSDGDNQSTASSSQHTGKTRSRRHKRRRMKNQISVNTEDGPEPSRKPPESARNSPGLPKDLQKQSTDVFLPKTVPPLLPESQRTSSRSKSCSEPPKSSPSPSKDFIEQPCNSSIQKTVNQPMPSNNKVELKFSELSSSSKPSEISKSSSDSSTNLSKVPEKESSGSHLRKTVHLPLFSKNNKEWKLSYEMAEIELKKVTKDITRNLANSSNTFPSAQQFNSTLTRIVYCAHCNANLLRPNNVLSHLTDFNHSAKVLKYGVGVSEISFWQKVVDQLIEDSKKCHIPFLTKISDSSDFLPHGERQGHLNSLMKHFNNSSKNMLDQQGAKLNLDLLPNTCGYCKVNINTKSFAVITDHIFSTDHLRHILEAGFSVAEVDFWISRLGSAKKKTQPKVLQTVSMEVKKLPEVVQPAKVVAKVIAPKKTPLTEKPEENASDLIEELNRLRYLLALRKLKLAVDRNVLAEKTVKGQNQCNICPSKCKSDLGFLDHIFTASHFEKTAKLGFTHKDVDFWKNAMISTGIMPSWHEELSEMLAPRKFVNKITCQKMFQWSFNQKNFRYVPLLDYSERSSDQHVPADQRRSVLQSLHAHYRFSPAKYEEELFNKHYHLSTCFMCEDKGWMTNGMDVLKHIFTDNHVKNLINHGFTISDVDIWKSYIEYEAPEKDEEVAPPTNYEEAVKKIAQAVQKCKVGCKAEQKETETGKSEDAVPLGLLYANIDEKLTFAQRQKVLSEERVAEEFDKFRAILKKTDANLLMKNYRSLRKRHHERSCLWCKVNLGEIWDLVLHIFSEGHQKMAVKYCQMTMSDFDEWRERLEKCQKTDSVPPKPIIPPVVVKRPPEPIKPKEIGTKPRIAVVDALYRLPPLPHSPEWKKLNRVESIYPLYYPMQFNNLSHIYYGSNFGSLHPELAYADDYLFRNLTINLNYCRYCDVDLKTTASVVRHAFTDGHFQKLRENGIEVRNNDVNYWVELRNKLRFSSSLPKTVFRFPLYDQTCGVPRDAPFCMPSKKDLEILGQTDEATYNESNRLIIKMCRYCNCPLEVASEIIFHAFSDLHLRKIKEAGIITCSADFSFWTSSLGKYKKQPK